MKIFKTLFAFFAMFTASLALAGGGGNHPPTPTPDTPLPLPIVGYTVDIGGGISFAGIGQGAFSGDEGNIEILKYGGGESVLNLNIGGDLCGFDCQNGSFDFAANAYEAVQVNGYTIGTGVDTPVMLQNAGQAQVGALFQFQRAPLPAPAAPTSD